MAMSLFYRPSSSAVLLKCAVSNDYRVIFNENATHDSKPNVTPTILLLLKNNYPFPHAIAIAGSRDLELPKYASKLFNFKNFSIYKMLILI